ncbi:predicted protein [Arabidopsis lyrata subsp. lyrata]|uniref:Predicted protein n=1 Tax=Arabidopsis lyrata subsp. lyrata TaxID=81972 RepID=D7M2P7_ARALL|nr:predicted protein [Arabidopsis lyrata subsp. lyrata]
MDMEHQISTEESIHGRLNCKEAFTSPVRCSILSHNNNKGQLKLSHKHSHNLNLILQQRRGLLCFRLLVDWQREEDQCPCFQLVGSFGFYES